jgi:hypothetical protein
MLSMNSGDGSAGSIVKSLEIWISKEIDRFTKLCTSTYSYNTSLEKKFYIKKNTTPRIFYLIMLVACSHERKQIQ